MSNLLTEVFFAPECHSLDAVMEWLDTEQREVTDERTQDGK